MTANDEPLAEADVRAGLRALPLWTGGTDRLQRTILADEAVTGRLREAVAAAADEADHHPVVEEVEGGTRFVLWTHTAGGVTLKDLRFAAHLDVVAAELDL
jgi:4a-hydroxytetrahydrobiopterin dehydratase